MVHIGKIWEFLHYDSNGVFRTVEWETFKDAFRLKKLNIQLFYVVYTIFWENMYFIRYLVLRFQAVKATISSCKTRTKCENDQKKKIISINLHRRRNDTINVSIYIYTRSSYYLGVWVGYFRFSSISVYGYKTCSSISIFRIGFRYF